MRKAMILAAGFGTRLGALTAETPKCLMTVAGKTMLEHVVDSLKRARVEYLVINLHYLGKKIEDFVAKKNNFGLEVHFSREPEILGTGGGVKNAKALLESEDHFIVHNADVYSEVDLNALIAAHEESQTAATLAVMGRKTSRPLLFNENKCLVGWESTENRGEVIPEQESIERLAFSGIQVVSSEIFSYMESETQAFSIIRSYMAAARAGRCVKAFQMDNSYWIDVGRPEHLEELRVKLGR